MTAISALVVTTTAKLLSPLMADLYGGAKGKVKESLKKLTLQAGAKKIARGLLKVENIKTIWSPDRELSVGDFYYPSKLDIYDQAVAVEGLEGLPTGNVIVEGIVGQGKSIFMRYLASAAMRSEVFDVIPVFLELRTISEKKNIESSVCRFLSSLGFDADADMFSYLASSGRMILLLDGFDEINASAVGSVLEEIEWLQVRFPELRIIISSRPGGEIQKVSGFEVVNILPLGKSDYEPFLKCLKISTHKRVELLEVLSKDATIVNGVISTPLMLTLVVMVYESEREIPSTLPEFFEKLFHVVFTRHDRLKVGFERKHYSGLSERDLQRLFEAFCFMAVQLGYGRSLDSEQFHESFSMALEYVEGSKCRAEDFRKDVVKVACLMMEEGIDSVTFLHKSIVEYYAAAFIKHSADDVASLFYKEALVDEDRLWGAVVNFLKEIDGFRYSRDYVLSGAPEHLGRLQMLLTSRSAQDLLMFLRDYYPEAVMSFDADGELQSIGPVDRFDSPWKSLVDDLIMDELFELAESSSVIKRAIDGEIDGVTSIDTEGGKSFGLAEIIKLFGDDGLWKAIALAEHELNSIVNQARTIVDTQQRRKLIFSKK